MAWSYKGTGTNPQRQRRLGRSYPEPMSASSVETYIRMVSLTIINLRNHSGVQTPNCFTGAMCWDVLHTISILNSPFTSISSLFTPLSPPQSPYHHNSHPPLQPSPLYNLTSNLSSTSSPMLPNSHFSSNIPLPKIRPSGKTTPSHSTSNRFYTASSAFPTYPYQIVS